MISNGGTSTLGLYDFKKQLDNFGGVNYFQNGVSYLPNARVMLTNGDIVKNNTSGNLTNNPNSDMTGWVKTNSTSQIFNDKGSSQSEINSLNRTVKYWGAIGDSTLHTVNDWTVVGSKIYYPNLTAIQVDYPHVTSLTDSIDWAAIQKTIDDLPLATENVGILSPKSSPNGGRVSIPKGRYILNKKITLKRGVQLVGESRESSQLMFTTTNGGIEYFDAGRDIPDEITIKDLAIFQDPNVTATSGAAITCIDGAAATQAVALNVSNVLINGFYHGVLLSAAITSCVRNANITNSVNHGVYVKFATGYTLSTSILFDTVYSTQSVNGSGFRIEGAAYSILNACASDSNARYGYELFQTNTISIFSGAEYNYLGGVHSTQCRSPKVFVNIVANASNTNCHAVTLDQTSGAIVGGVHSSGAGQGGMSINSIASGTAGTVEIGCIRTGGWSNTSQRSNAPHSISLGGSLNGFTGGAQARQWAFGVPSPLNNIQLQNSGNADSTVEHGFISDVVLAKNNASSNSAIIANAQTANTAVTYGVLNGFHSKAPVKGASSTIGRYNGVLVDESNVGGTANTNMMIGGLFAPSGNWSIYNASTRPNYHGGPSQLQGGLGLFGTTTVTSKRSITGKLNPTTQAETNAVLSSIVSALVSYGFVTDDRTA